MNHQTQQRFPSLWNRSVFVLLGSLSCRSAIFFTLLLCGSSIASQNAIKEDKAKVALLYNFAKFTTWPSQAFDNDDSPLVIAVIGPNRFGNILNDIKNKRVKGRRIEIRHYRTPEDYDPNHSSHVLFCNVGSIRAFKDLAIELELEKHHVLTVGDIPGFAHSGGIIGLRFVGNRLALQINQVAAREAKIYLSEHLVGLAEKVH